MSPAGAGPAALAAGAVLLAVLAPATARRPVQPVPDRDGYYRRWSALHGGYDPRRASVWVRSWLTLVHRVGRPLARRGVQPDVVTALSLWCALAVLVAADAGGRWPLLAAAALVASGLADNLDGCLAVLEDRATAWGYVLDSVVDRLSDVTYLTAAAALGAPVGLVVAVGVGVLLLEYVRARAGNAGGEDVGTVTVGERPTRVIVLTAALLAAGALPGRAAAAVGAGVGVLGALTAVALVQLGVAVRRQLTRLPADRRVRSTTVRG